MLPMDAIDRIASEIKALRDKQGKIIFTNQESYKLAVVAYRYQHPDFNDEVLA